MGEGRLRQVEAATRSQTQVGPGWGGEVFEEADVEAAIHRLGAESLPREVEIDKTCGYAKRNKVWSVDPEGARWEWYRVLANSETFGAG